MTLTGQPRIEPHTQLQLVIKVEGRELGLEALNDLLEVRVELGVRTVGRATITFADRENDLLRSQLDLGKEVQISSVEPATVLMTGTVTGLDMDASITGTTVTVTVQDHAYKMARNRSVSTFRDQGYTDVIKQVASSAGLSVSVPAVPGQLPWLLQADSSLGLVDEIAGRLGFDWVVSGNELAVWQVTRTAPKTQPRTLELGVELLAFSARRAEVGPTEFAVRGWDSETQNAYTATVTTSTARDGFAPPRGGTAAKVLATDLLSPTDPEVKAVAKGLAAAAGRVSGRGRAHFVPELRPGGEVTIKGSGSADGRYYVREVSHQVDAGSLRTSFVVGDRAPIQLSDPWRNPPAASSLRHSGLTVGIVDNVDDPDRCGRVRVQLIGLSDSESSAWARVLALGGGAHRGMVMLPEVGDEVLVAFEDDDVRRPVVLGGLYSKKVAIAGPAAVQDGKIVSRHLVSRLGHSIALSDGTNAEFVQMALADGKKRMQIGKNASEIATDNTPLTISSGGASIKLDGRGGIEIDATMVTIKAKQSLKLEGLDIAAKAQTKVEVSGLTTSISGSTQATVKGGATVEISGAIVKIN